MYAEFAYKEEAIMMRILNDISPAPVTMRIRCPCNADLEIDSNDFSPEFIPGLESKEIKFSFQCPKCFLRYKYSLNQLSMPMQQALTNKWNRVL